MRRGTSDLRRDRILDRGDQERVRRGTDVPGGGQRNGHLRAKPVANIHLVVDRGLPEKTLRDLMNLLFNGGRIAKAGQALDQCEQVQLLPTRRLKVDVEVDRRVGRRGPCGPIGHRGEEEQVADDHPRTDHDQQRGDRDDQPLHALAAKDAA